MYLSLFFFIWLYIVAGLVHSNLLNEYRVKDCNEEPALLAISIDSIIFNKNIIEIGQWRLPHSPFQPQQLSMAKLGLTLRHIPEKNVWIAELHFTFDDPKPYGLPFSFQRAKLTWLRKNQRVREWIEWDWAHQCRGIGWSLFPGQNHKEEANFVKYQEQDEINFLHLQLWGARN